MPIGDEAINVFMGMPGEDPRLELTYNHGVDSYELGSGYNHIALASDDLDGTLGRLAAKASSPRSRPTARRPHRGPPHLLRPRPRRLPHRADRRVVPAQPGLMPPPTEAGGALGVGVGAAWGELSVSGAASSPLRLLCRRPFRPVPFLRFRSFLLLVPPRRPMPGMSKSRRARLRASTVELRLGVGFWAARTEESYESEEKGTAERAAAKKPKAAKEAAPETESSPQAAPTPTPSAPPASSAAASALAEPGLLADQLDAVAVGVADEADAVALGAGAGAVGRLLGLDAFAGEPPEGAVEVVDGEAMWL